MKDRLAEIRARLEAATSGPWFVAKPRRVDGLAEIEDGRLNGLFPIVCEYSEAEFIAHAPDDIAYLLAEVERLRLSLTMLEETEAEHMTELQALRAAP